MNRKEFRKILNEKILVLDGATGTELQKKSMPKGVCPEKWVYDNPSVIQEIQKNYFDAGSDIVYACTFGCNRIKLDEFGLGEKVIEFNKGLVKISKDITPTGKFVAGDIAPTGKFVEPYGDLKFEEAVNVYKEQITALLEAGVDLLVIETMMDVQETRAALIAARETCDLPVMTSLTFSDNGRTLTGTDPLTALITLQSLGADAFGCNCSTGPGDMLKIIKSLKAYSKIPLLAKPNAGLPILKNGATVFNMTSGEFSATIPDFISAGINLIGGCCGTTPDFIKTVANLCKDARPIQPAAKNFSAVTSAYQTVFFGISNPVTIIGERINPTGKKELQAELRSGKFDIIRDFASSQKTAGAKILDVNVGMPGINETEKMTEAINFLSKSSVLPLCVDSSSVETIEAALRLYPGRALLNSISGEKLKLEKLMPVAAKYGSMFIALPLNEKSVPEKAVDRIKILKKIIACAKKNGFDINDIIADGLVMTVSSNQTAAVETLNVIEWCATKQKMNTVLGLSNISFGLPERKLINSAFLAMATDRGLSAAIANPSDELLISIKYAADVLTVRDEKCINFIEKFSGKQSHVSTATFSSNEPEVIFAKAVVNGNTDKALELARLLLDRKINAFEIINSHLIPAIRETGDFYEKKIFFLPQLISSAETMRAVFDILEPLLTKNEAAKKKKKIIMATVYGDIHDIGKNIASLMLRNYGYEVIDLGKNILAEDIVETAVKNSANIIGLSALMTTTMQQMKTVVDIINTKKLDIKVIIGGAVITQNYADEIGAFAYAKDPLAAVKALECL